MMGSEISYKSSSELINIVNENDAILSVQIVKLMKGGELRWDAASELI